jgi:ribonucleoside-diphosphate reductase beta chain
LPPTLARSHSAHDDDVGESDARYTLNGSTVSAPADIDLGVGLESERLEGVAEVVPQVHRGKRRRRPRRRQRSRRGRQAAAAAQAQTGLGAPTRQRCVILDGPPEDEVQVMDRDEFPAVWALHSKQEECYWIASPLDLTSDRKASLELPPEVISFLQVVLSFFMRSDLLVNANLQDNVIGKVKCLAVSTFYRMQAAMEDIHSHTYTLLLEAYMPDAWLRAQHVAALPKHPALVPKTAWAQKWIDSKTASFAERLVAFACVEGIQFSASFCAIFYLRKRGYQLFGLFQSNEYIARDEGLHTDFACLVYSMLAPHNKISKERIHQIIREAVDAELTFVVEALRVALVGMNATTMSTYVRFCADRLAVALTGEKVYSVANPYDFMEPISLEGKNNMFERRITDYSHVGKKHGDKQFIIDYSLLDE